MKTFELLINLFIKENNEYNGTIRQKIADLEDNSSLFELPRVIETKTHRKHWIRHYPSALCSVEYLLKISCIWHLLIVEVATFSCR